jgi:CBS domain containing-hemolysin-like protein
MNISALGWFLLNMLTLLFLGFYSMQEMAAVSFNRLRLQYYVSEGMKRAVWIQSLLQHPARLFGTTLIGVNVAMFIGSECARRTYASLGFNPDLAPLTQIFLVIIFAELAPMFAARRYPEHVALLGAPIMYATSILLSPILWSVDCITTLVDKAFGKKKAHHPVVLNQEELQRILSVQDEEIVEGETVNRIARSIFGLKDKEANHIMQPLSTLLTLPTNTPVFKVQKAFAKSDVQVILIYHKDPAHITGIVHSRDLIRAPLTKRVGDYASPPWFITRQTKILQILKEFRRNNKNVAIVLNAEGLAIGMILLENLVEEIFGRETEEETPSSSPLFLMERSFPADMLVGDFNAQFEVVLDSDTSLTLAELMERELGHPPEAGETVSLDLFELSVKETFLTSAKTIHVITY